MFDGGVNGRGDHIGGLNGVVVWDAVGGHHGDCGAVRHGNRNVGV